MYYYKYSTCLGLHKYCLQPPRDTCIVYTSRVLRCQLSLGYIRKQHRNIHTYTASSNNRTSIVRPDTGRMSQVTPQLTKRETRGDRYFMEKLDGLSESISRWARLYSRGQPPITLEDMRTIRITPRVRDYLTSAFLDIRLLLNAKNVGGKVRTRFVEAIMLRTLMGDRLWKRHIGFLESDYESRSNLIQRMHCTGKEGPLL